MADQAYWQELFASYGANGSAQVDPSDPVVYMGKKSATGHGGDDLIAGKYAPGSTNGAPNPPGSGSEILQSTSQAYLVPYESDATRQVLGEQMYENGLIADPHDYDAINKMWQQAVNEAARFRQAGRNLTPFEVLDIIAGQSAQKNQSRSHTTTSTNTSIPNAADIASAVQQIFKDSVGRAPTDEELSKYRGMLTAKAKASPDRSTTTTTYDAAGNATSSNTVTQQGLDASGLAYEAQQRLQDTEEYGTQQAALYYYNTLASVIGG